MSPSAPTERLDWMQVCTDQLLNAVVGLDPEQWDQPTSLPGWRRREVIAHVHRNAEALCNLATWARTGIETPMYADFATRDRDIALTAALPPEQMVEQLVASASRLTQMLGELEAEHWGYEVRTAQGRTVEASEVPWMRCREVGVHTVDLALGVDFVDLPAGFVDALAVEIVKLRITRGEGPVLTGWLTGRTANAVLDPWL